MRQTAAMRRIIAITAAEEARQMTQKYTCPSCQEEHEFEVEPEEISAGVALVECPHSNGRHEIEIRSSAVILAELIEANRVHTANEKIRDKTYTEYHAAIEAHLVSELAVNTLRAELLDSVAAEAGVA